MNEALPETEEVLTIEQLEAARAPLPPELAPLPSSIYDQHQEILFAELDKQLAAGKATAGPKDEEWHEWFEGWNEGVDTLGNTPAARLQRSALFREKALFEVRRGQSGVASWYVDQGVTDFRDKLILFHEAVTTGDSILFLALGDLRAEAERSDNPRDLIDYLLAEITEGYAIETNLEAVSLLINDGATLSTNLERHVYTSKKRRALTEAAVLLLEQGRGEDVSALIRDPNIDKYALDEITDLLVLCETAHTDLSQLNRFQHRKVVTELKKLRFALGESSSNQRQAAAIEIAGMAYAGLPEARKLLPQARARIWQVSESKPSLYRYFHQLFPDPINVDEALHLNYGIPEKTQWYIQTALEHNRMALAEAAYARAVNEGKLSDFMLMRCAMALALYADQAQHTHPEMQAYHQLMGQVEVVREMRATAIKTLMVGDRVDEVRFRTSLNRELEQLANQVNPQLHYLAEKFLLLSEIAALQKEHDTGPDSLWKSICYRLQEVAEACLNNRIALLSVSEKEMRARFKELGLPFPKVRRGSKS